MDDEAVDFGYEEEIERKKTVNSREGAACQGTRRVKTEEDARKEQRKEHLT